MKVADIKELIKAFDASGITQLKLDGPDGKFELKKEVVVGVQAPTSILPVANEPSVLTTAQNEDAFVKSPLVGVAYYRPKPDAEPFVTVGSKVKKGQTLCVVEAMKMFNEIKAPHDGTILSVLFEDGALVEFEQPLFEWEKCPC